MVKLESQNLTQEESFVLNKSGLIKLQNLSHDSGSPIGGRTIERVKEYYSQVPCQLVNSLVSGKVTSSMFPVQSPDEATIIVHNIASYHFISVYKMDMEMFGYRPEPFTEICLKSTDEESNGIS